MGEKPIPLLAEIPLGNGPQRAHLMLRLGLANIAHADVLLELPNAPDSAPRQQEGER